MPVDPTGLGQGLSSILSPQQWANTNQINSLLPSQLTQAQQDIQAKNIQMQGMQIANQNARLDSAAKIVNIAGAALGVQQGAMEANQKYNLIQSIAALPPGATVQSIANTYAANGNGQAAAEIARTGQQLLQSQAETGKALTQTQEGQQNVQNNLSIKRSAFANNLNPDMSQQQYDAMKQQYIAATGDTAFGDMFPTVPNQNQLVALHAANIETGKAYAQAQAQLQAKAQNIQQLGQQGQQPQPVPGAQPSAGPALSPQMQTGLAAQNSMNMILSPNHPAPQPLQTNPNNTGTVASAQSDLAQKGYTSDVQGLAQIYGPKPGDIAVANNYPDSQQAKNLTANREQSLAWAKQYQGADQQSQTQLQVLNNFSQSLKDVATGHFVSKLNVPLQAATQVLQNLGLPVKSNASTNDILDMMNSGQVAQAIKSSGINIKNQSELNQIAGAIPGKDSSPIANQYAVNNLAIETYEKGQTAKFIQKYVQANNGDYTGAQNAWPNSDMAQQVAWLKQKNSEAAQSMLKAGSGNVYSPQDAAKLGLKKLNIPGINMYFDKNNQGAGY
jgi:predicted nuclease of predicted toxin-antitoxin system